jgi:hypothetical protein
MSGVLEKIGLTRGRVQFLLGNVQEEKHRYLYGPRQKFIRERMQEHDTWLVSQYLSGEPPNIIAASLGVSEESVRRRLRAHDLFHTGGSAGRPVRVGQLDEVKL